MRALVLVLLAAAPLVKAPKRVDAPKVVEPLPTFTVPTVVVPVKATGHAFTPTTSSNCGACHTTTKWTEVRFNHDRTGYSLTGRHAVVRCKDCHGSNFETPLPRACVGCHRDVHTQELGALCESCHDTESWRSKFDAEAHRRSNFPLLGGHAALPCTECHVEVAERRFSRANVTCGACHAADYQRTALTSVDHARSGFDSQSCIGCHNAFRFKPARYPGHDCFPTEGPHALTCGECHKGGAIVRRDLDKRCSTGTVSCISCHEHDCSTPGNATDLIHTSKNVPGYGTTCTSTKCVACHGSQ